MKKALITGANSMVNIILVDKLVSMGYKVTAHYHSDNELTKQIKAEHPDVSLIQADFTDEGSITSFIGKATEEGKYDVLVNGAVTYKEAGDDWREKQADWQTWQENFSVNTTVPALLMRNADKLVNKGGVVINISSMAANAQMAQTQFLMYGASKAALDLITVGFAKIFAPDIRVVGIAPGYVRSAWNKGMEEKTLQEILKVKLTRRLVEPEEIADLMEVIIKSPSINATTLLIDGGYTAPFIE
jgi:NAD(P)-dependent dehydrogenase (short-subunit alcohol dehydrogenase family)